MPLTRAKAIEAFKHVLTNVHEVSEDGPLSKALHGAGYDDICTMGILCDQDIDSLTFDRSNTEKDIPLSKVIRANSCIFWHYIIHWHSIGDTIGDEWVSISLEDFDEYRFSPEYQASLAGITPPPLLSPQQNPWVVHSAVANFKWGIKHDPSLFMTFKDGKQFDSWQHSTMAQAQAQDVAEILDSSYIPNTQDEKDLFEEKQKYMFAVFEQMLQTDTGKVII